MSQMNDLLNERTQKNANRSKMAEMAVQSSSGHLTSFGGVFSLSELSSKEKSGLAELLKTYAKDNENIEQDLSLLISLSSEVKAINNQAALLHGERIKKAHQILTRYKDGAFTSWLMAIYGNRQTPYNFLQYYEFYQQLPKTLRVRLEEMPRQAVYTLASRAATLEEKKQIVEVYKGETKTELLEMIRRAFPLQKSDQRRENMGEKTIKNLEKILLLLKEHSLTFSKGQKNMITHLLNEIKSHL